jgi:hypothetical protein
MTLRAKSGTAQVDADLRMVLQVFSKHQHLSSGP